MALDSRFEMLDKGIAKITLVGELDGGTAGVFQKEVEKAVSGKARRLVLVLSGLSYMASAGLRVLVFAKQKMEPGVDIYVVGTQPPVMDTITKTGMHHSVVALPSYDAAAIENF
jgi:anti-anti-sigma factor